MRVLKCFSRCLANLSPLQTSVSLRYVVSVFNVVRDSILVYIPDREYIVNKPFSGEWFLSALI